MSKFYDIITQILKDRGEEVKFEKINPDDILDKKASLRLQGELDSHQSTCEKTRRKKDWNNCM